MQSSKFLNLTGAAAAIALATACGGSSTPPAQSAQGQNRAEAKGAAAPAGDPRCPMLLDDVTVVASPIAYGVALAFSTTPGQVDELRQRVEPIASSYNPPGAGSAAEAGATPLDWPTPSFKTRAQYEETQEGGRVNVTAVDSSDAAALRDHATQLARKLSETGSCPTALDE
ncbi:MAG: hypothetical protein JW940_10985 [Polyangiaceae bacterium]|nr:hypothetical protein [Polyangiaceae bacterium]